MYRSIPRKYNLLPGFLLNSNITYSNRVKSVFGSSLIQHLKMDELIGTTSNDSSGNNRNGTYTNITLNNLDFVKGGRAGLWNGNTSLNNIYSASLASAFNGSQGTILFWSRVNAGSVWADGAIRVFLRLLVDGNNFIQIDKQGVGTIRLLYNAGGTTENVSFSNTTTDWFSIALTWNKTADRVRGYFNGVQQGSTQTSLGTWTGSLASTGCALGSAGSPAGNVWLGQMAHYALGNTELTPAQIASIGT